MDCRRTLRNYKVGGIFAIVLPYEAELDGVILS